MKEKLALKPLNVVDADKAVEEFRCHVHMTRIDFQVWTRCQ